MIVISGKNKALANTLQQSLERLQEEVTHIHSVEEIKAVRDYANALALIEFIDPDKNRLTDEYIKKLYSIGEKIPLFVISPANLQQGIAGKHLDKIHADEYFFSPIRAGRIIDRILSQKSGIRNFTTPETIDIGRLVLDSVEKTVKNKKDNEILTALTDKERDMLVYLARAKGRAVAREQILKDVWGYSKNVETHTLETHIHRLRNKIEENPASPKIIVTDDIGYMLFTE